MSKGEVYKAWRLKNKERLAEKRKEYYRLHKEVEQKMSIEWKKKNRAAQQEYKRKWRMENPEANKLQILRATHIRRARMRGAAKEDNLILTDIYNWDTRICGICHGYIDGDFDIDHITPLSRGGGHTLDNLQLTHPICNRKKHNKLPSELLVV